MNVVSYDYSLLGKKGTFGFWVLAMGVCGASSVRTPTEYTYLVCNFVIMGLLFVELELEIQIWMGRIPYNPLSCFELTRVSKGDENSTIFPVFCSHSWISI